ncbi:MAG: phosphoglucosamine mutase, partial [Alphaproteobacteria bacterium]|nr:phosphoglucosamine mutase [Alphaproteobacteria bacterium]
PDGFNINQGCGSTDTSLLQETVLREKADIGIALDGDADRLIIVDEKGQQVDGDQLIGLIATNWQKRDILSAPGVVATIMSNLELERYLNSMNLDLIRTCVGDRYVAETMHNKGYNLGGEQSGHMIMSDFITTGDGLIAALQLLAVMNYTQKPVSQLVQIFQPLPQLLKNIPIGANPPLENTHVKQAIREGENRLGKTGRLVIRKSGTEPLIRIMGEGDDERLVQQVVGDIAHVIEKQAIETHVTGGPVA